MKKFIIAVMLVVLPGCATAVGHEAPPKQKVVYGSRMYNEWHDSVYVYCGQQPDPWKCAIHHGIAF